MMIRPRSLPTVVAFVVSALVLGGKTANAQTVRTLVLEDQEFFGIGTVNAVKNLRINDAGEWVVHIDTDAVPSYVGDVLLRNGLVTLQGGDSLVAPPGAEVGALGEYSFSGLGDLASLITLRNWDSGSDRAVYFNSSPVAQESFPVLAPEFSPGTTWFGFDQVRVNDLDQVLIIGEVADPAISGPSDWALVIAQVDSLGNVLSEKAVFWETGTIPGGSRTIEKFGGDFRALAFNHEGDFLTYVDTSGAGNTDGMLYLSNGSGFTRLAQEGSPSPIAGRNWSSLYNKSLALNDVGGHAYIGTLTGSTDSDQLLVKNGEKYVQEGDFLPKITPFRILNFQNAPIRLSNSDDLFWFGLFDETDYSQNTAIFRNKAILVQEGTTPAEGQHLNGLRPAGQSFSISANGRYVIFEAVLDDRREGAFLLDLGLVERMSECHGNRATLELADGLPLLGETLEFELDGAQGIGATPILMVSSLPVDGWPGCGLALPFGELLIDLSSARGNPALFLLGLPWGGTPSEIPVSIPDDPSFVGFSAYAQGLFWDIGDLLPEENLRLTGARHILIVAP